MTRKNTPKRRISVVSGGRADYGLLLPLLREIDSDPNFELQLILTGSHLAQSQGHTADQVRKDGFDRFEKVSCLLDGDGAAFAVKAMGLGMISFADLFSRLKPDLLIVLGDRFEIVVAAQAALIFRIPVAHLHGGEITEGAFDDSIRHCLTKIASLHFASNESYRRRIIQMGEQPSSVHSVGALGLDLARSVKKLSKNEWAERVGVPLGTTCFLVTFHPATLGNSDPRDEIDALLEGLDQFPEASIIFTKANADPGGMIINEILEEYCQRNSHRAVLRSSLGSLLYLNALRHVDVVIGNSSSGIIEAPFFGTPTVNIGSRQDGRIAAPSVIHVKASARSVSRGIADALAKKTRKREFASGLYGDGKSAKKIVRVLRSTQFEGLEMKQFFDLPIKGNL